MKKTILIIIAIILAVGAGVWWWNSQNNNKRNAEVENNTSNYQAERSNVKQNIDKDKDIDNNNINNTNSTNTTNQNNNTDTPTPKNEVNTTQKKETEISQFSTKIHNKDPERQNNIAITCKTLSNKEVGKGETFSFCNTVGKATSSKGYQEADIYVDGKKKQGLGGGNCQVSTTLYNAVLKVSGLEVVERHQHSGKIPYIQQGKDAAVSYGAYDLKFKNNTNNAIKIVMENTSDNITAKLIKLE